jgi:putative ABC transport system permease protein
MISFQELRLAGRNVFRNTRRSAVTIIAIMLSCAGLILFAGYVAWAFRSAEGQTVVIFSHIQLFKRGYYENGAGNPAAYAIGGYQKIKDILAKDPVIGSKLSLVTGQILFNGIVSCADTRTSSTFIGMGVFPEEDWKLVLWNPYRLVSPVELPINKDLYRSAPELASDDPDGASLGVGLARILGLTPGLKQSSQEAEAPASSTPQLKTAEADLSALSLELPEARPLNTTRPSIELVCAPPGGGMPNATTMSLRKVFSRATKELDDGLIKVNIHRASELLFPGEELKVTSILVLLKRTQDVPLVVARLKQLNANGELDLDFRTWTELRPFYNQLTQMFRIMFAFMFSIIAVIVTFTIYNTLSMGIAERVGEIGTLRALGVTRAGIRRAFLLEGFLLGLFGGVLGVVLGLLGDWIINSLQVVYIPPGGSFHIKLEVLVLRAPIVLAICFGGSMIAAICSAILPALRASRMVIVDALRH